jgi:glycerol-3-phosphate dehydrogenase
MPVSRPEQIAALRSTDFDVLVLGGGINGAGVLRDLALRSAHSGRPLRAALVEQGHFASGTSGRNSQLIHGGLRYLKYFEFPLVKEALHERAVLLRTAPHLVKPLPFLMPMYGWFSEVFYGTGLYLYDLLAGSRNISRHRSLPKKQVSALEPSMNVGGLTGAAIFYDCGVHSARLVVEAVLDAVRHGAIAANYVEAQSWTKESTGLWRIELRDKLTGETWETRARKLIDATGAWSKTGSLRLVRGSHIILPRFMHSRNAMAYFDKQGRIVFFIPWGTRNQLTLVGTTDIDHAAGPDRVHISTEETAYLQSVVKLLYPSADTDPISTYSSLRPLIGGSGSSATSASRGHRIWNGDDGVLHIAGGKYTTYRAMSEEACDLALQEVAPELAAVHVTANAAFPKPEADILSIENAVQNEMAQRLPDYLYISTYLGYEQRWTPETLRPIAKEMGALLGWDDARMEDEIQSVLNRADRPS